MGTSGGSAAHAPHSTPHSPAGLTALTPCPQWLHCQPRRLAQGEPLARLSQPKTIRSAARHRTWRNQEHSHFSPPVLELFWPASREGFWITVITAPQFLGTSAQMAPHWSPGLLVTPWAISYILTLSSVPLLWCAKSKITKRLI